MARVPVSRLAMIADNSTAVEAFVSANVKPGATLITDGHAAYPGLSSHYGTIRALSVTWRRTSSCRGASALSRC